MKKLLLIFAAAILTSCTCIMSQGIPPQILEMDSTCGAAMPNYIPLFTYTDNCGIDTVWQSPTWGSWLTQPTTNAMIRAIDNSGNYTDLLFTVNLVDTKPPEIILNDSTLISDNYSKINSIYDVADRLLARHELWVDGVLPDSLQTGEDYFNEVLLTWTSPGLAFGLPGGRYHTFVNRGDTLIIPLTY